MKIILTGANGFLGKAIEAYFQQEDLVTLSRTAADISFDLSAGVPNLPLCDLVIHSAAKAHSVPKTDAEKKMFHAVNVQGTENLLKALETSSGLPKSFVLISSVSVYGLESGENIDELQPLKATDAYGKSKIEAEQLVESWCKRNNVICTILRLPLLAGKNPPGNLQSMIHAIAKGFYFNIAGGKAKKSMLMNTDVAPFIASIFQTGGIYNLTDGKHPSFKTLASVISSQLKKKSPVSLPYFLVNLAAKIGDLLGAKAPINSKKLSKMTNSLTFSDQKAQDTGSWAPKSVADNFTL